MTDRLEKTSFEKELMNQISHLIELLENSEKQRLEQEKRFAEQEERYLSELAELKEKDKQNSQKIDELLGKIHNLQINIDYYTRQLYGRKTEKLNAQFKDPNLISLFDLDYPEPASDPSRKDDDDDDQNHGTASGGTRRRKYNGQRKDSMENLHHEKIVSDLPEEEKFCGVCGHKLTVIGEKYLGTKVKIKPATVIAVDHYAKTYKCEECEKETGESVLQTAPCEEVAHAPIPGSFATASSVAYVINERFFKGLPYNRIAREFKFIGWKISRTTLSNWAVYTAQNLFRPIYDLLHEVLITRSHLHADETRMMVLLEPKRSNETMSWMWVYTTVKEDLFPIRIYDYTQTREGVHPKHFLAGFEGVIISDGLSGYNAVENAERAGCWAHMRRKFFDALPADRTQISEEDISVQALRIIREIFTIEREISLLPAQEKVKERQSRTKRLVDAFFAWAKEQKGKMTAASNKVKTAFTYALNQEERLRKFLEDGLIPATNSMVERTIRPFAQGRQAWQFAGSPRGAEANAVLYTIVETAKANLLNPYQYILYILENLPKVKVRSKSDLERFLPWSDEVQMACGI